MEKEIYTPMEKVLIEGANRIQHRENLCLLLAYEMEKLMEELEAKFEAEENARAEGVEL